MIYIVNINLQYAIFRKKFSVAFIVHLKVYTEETIALQFVDGNYLKFILCK